LDYDGDQVTVKGVFSQEANEEAERIMRAYTNILSVNGNNIRISSIECIETLYCVTQWDNPNKKFDTRKSK
jgi:DNA-directed RNA polymerase beta' subunit